MEVKVCANCEYCWEGAEEEHPEFREACPKCGAVARRISVHIKENALLRESYGGKIKDPNLPSKKKVRVEFFDGYECSVALEKQVKKSRTIDRRENTYHEKVQDPETGEVLHECTEPLKKHKGHGYAKFSKKKT